MAIPTSTILRLAAVGTLASGVALALGASRAPVGAAGLDAGQIRELAARLEAAQEKGSGLVTPLNVPAGPIPALRAVRPVKPVVSAPRMGLQPPVLPKPGGALISLATPAPPVLKPAPAPAPAIPEDPAKNVALLGITHANGEDSAWLVDLRDQDREIIEIGEQAFGFTLKEIEEDHVVLARGGDEVTLHLGEKRIASNSSSVTSGASGSFETPGSSGGDGAGRGRGSGRGGFGGGMAGFGGMSGFGGRGSGMGSFGGFGGGSGGFGGRSRSGRSGGYSASSGSSSGGSYGGSSGGGRSASGNSGGRGSFGGQSSGGYAGSSGGSGRSSGGGRGSGFGGAGFGGAGQSGGSASQFSSSSAVSSTSNPQTARRRGARLTGGADPIETPAAVANPQTTRRLGTSSTGAAFGQEPGGGARR